MGSNNLQKATYLLPNTQIIISKLSKTKLSQYKKSPRDKNIAYLYSKNPAHFQQSNKITSETKYNI